MWARMNTIIDMNPGYRNFLLPLQKIGTSSEQCNLCLWHGNAACNIIMQWIVITVGCGRQLNVCSQGVRETISLQDCEPFLSKVHDEIYLEY